MSQLTAGSDGGSGPTGPDLWSLHARTDLIAAAAQDWRTVARAATQLVTRIRASTDPLPPAWSGESQRAYFAHREGLFGAATALSTMASATAETLDRAGRLLATAQDHLDDVWARLRRAWPAPPIPPGQFPLPVLAVGPAAAAYAAARAEALDIRAHTDLALLALTAAATGARLGLAEPRQALTVDVNQEWQHTAEQTAPGAVILDGRRAIINASGADDHVVVDRDPATGDHVVTITTAGRPPVVRRFAADTDLVVRGGDGADTVDVGPGATFAIRPGLSSDVVMTVPGGVGGVTVLAGDGDDVVTGDGSLYGGAGHDVIIGGIGAGYVSGGDGNDYLDGGAGDDDISGDRGDDTLYGLDGADRLWGGTGVDYLDGGRGADVVAGGADNDMAFGGRGADVVLGGAGADRLYGGEGTDRIYGGPGTDDRAFAQPDDDVRGVDQRTDVRLTDAGTFIQVAGDQHFTDRVQSDLDALRSSPAGEQMLTTLQVRHQVDGDSLVVTEFAGRNGYDHDFHLLGDTSFDLIQYNPIDNGLPRIEPAPPLVLLYHELAHVDDFFQGTAADGSYGGPDNPGVRNLERQAVGLPIDHDHDPRTPERIDPAHPFALTENGLRQELGLPARPRY